MTEETKPHTLTGAFRAHESFRSQFLSTERTLIVFVPPGYEGDEARRYPVLYLHDGQNIFDKATAFGEEWRADETAQRLIESGAVEPMIMVGIYNTGEHRLDEYTPTGVEGKGGGQADAYGQMLVQEVKPFIDQHYRTLPSTENTALGGSSLGGLVTMHLGLKYPTVFGKLAVLSPSVWWDGRVILREVEALPGKLPLRIWLDAGTGEGQEVTSDTRMLRDALIAKGWTLEGDLRYYEAEGAGHDERSWAARMDAVLAFLFPAKT
jgi:predicted alpha/beta superfamily hydrolase